MVTVKVTAGEGIVHNGTMYAVGQQFETTEAHAAWLVHNEPGKFAVVPHPKHREEK